MPKLYIDEFVGVSNRFETLPPTFAFHGSPFDVLGFGGPVDQVGFVI